MDLSITQDTFDNAVRENIEDLGMEPEEALEEAIVQFEKQGANLTNIIKELKISCEQTNVIEKELKKLKELTKSKDDPETTKSVLELLEIIRIHCDKGIQYRVAAAQTGAYQDLLQVLEKYSENYDIKKHCLKSLTALMVRQPDLLDDKGLDIIISHLKVQDEEVKRLTLRWVKECCVLHEMNRQKLVEQGKIVDYLTDILKVGHIEVLKEALIVCRLLVLDDDVRVEFGKAHEHARIIANNSLCLLASLLSKYKFDESLVNDIILTISSLLVRAEFCKKIKDAGGIDLIGDVLKHFTTDEKIIRHCFKLFKSLAGNDECKVYIIQKKLAPVIVEALNETKKNVPTAVAGLACVAALTLRSPENSKAFFEADIPQVILDTMKFHSGEKQVQKTASWAIRNMVSRSKYQNETFMKLGIEEILQNNLKKFKDIEYDTKAALRDLCCKVALNEEWTGKGGALTTGQDNFNN